MRGDRGSQEPFASPLPHSVPLPLAAQPLLSWAEVPGSWAPGSPWTPIRGRSGLLRGPQLRPDPVPSWGPCRGSLDIPWDSELGTHSAPQWRDLSCFLSPSSPLSSLQISGQEGGCSRLAGTYSRAESSPTPAPPTSCPRHTPEPGRGPASCKAPQDSAVVRAGAFTSQITACGVTGGQALHL